MPNDVSNFKSGETHYEIFFSSDDEHIEIYERDNPKNGLIFETHKQLIGFINSLTDIVEDKVG